MSYEIDTKTPMPVRRPYNTVSKYDKLLDTMEVGQSVKTKDARAAKILYTSLSARLTARKLNHLRVALRSDMDDGYHRVFLIEREIKKKSLKMADVPGRVIRNLD